MTFRRATYFVLAAALLATAIVAGGSSLWCTLLTKWQLPVLRPIDDAVQQAAQDLAGRLAEQGLLGTFKPVQDISFETGEAGDEDALTRYAHVVNTWFSVAMADAEAGAGRDGRE